MLQRSLSAAAARAMHYSGAAASASVASISMRAAAPAASASAAASASLRLLHISSAAFAPKKEGANPSKREATNKGMRAKHVANEEEAEPIAPTLDSAAAAAVASAAAPKGAGAGAESRSLKKVRVANLAKSSASIALRESRVLKARARVAAAAERRLAAQQESVIEKEVPLMDLTGLTPGQNKVRRAAACASDSTRV